MNRNLAIRLLSIQERAHTNPNIADVLRLARERRIGRPSTYAKHQERLQDLVKGGLASCDKDERYSITELGREALAILTTQCFADVGVAECEALEADLEAIESGRLSPLEVARKHIGFVKSLPSATREESMIATSDGVSTETTLPITLDPERSLSPDHRLRRAKTSLWKRLSQGPTMASNRGRSAQRAIVARVAGARLWRLDSNNTMLDELRFNLAYRWICELGPDDAVWDKSVFETLVSDSPQLAAELDDILLKTLR
ncbi:MAG: transposase [Bacillati bacterium]